MMPIGTDASADPIPRSLCLLDHRRCCACPETKAARDECFFKFGHSVEEHGESARKCEELVKKHRECMASLGYKI